MLEADTPKTDQQDLGEIAAAQRRLIQLLAKAVAGQLANESGRDQSDCTRPRERA